MAKRVLAVENVRNAYKILIGIF